MIGRVLTLTPMVDPKDLITWTEDEVILHVHELLARDQELECVPGDDVWEIRISETTLREDDEGEPVSEEVLVWEDYDLTRRGAYFKAYYRLWDPPKRSPDDPWTLNQHRPTLRAVADQITEKFSDPEDLDPEAVASVYAKTNPQTRRK